MAIVKVPRILREKEMNKQRKFAGRAAIAALLLSVAAIVPALSEISGTDRVVVSLTEGCPDPKNC